MLAKWWFPLGLLAVGAMALVVPSGYSVGFYALSLASLVLWVKRRPALVTAQTRWFFIPLLAYGLGMFALTMAEAPNIREIGRHLPFVLTLFGVWGIQTYQPRAQWFWAGLTLGAVGAALFSGYQALALGMRAGGFTHPIQFGNVALLLGVLCLIRAFASPAWTAFNACMWLGFLSGLAASVCSQTRGGWLAVLLIFVWIFLNATRHWPRRQRGMVALVLFAVLATPALQPDGVVQSRIRVAVSEFKAFSDHGQQDTSVGARLIMWQLGVEGLQHAPFLGAGEQGWLNTRDAALADGRLSEFSANFTHLHNEYLDIAFKHGLVGLVLYLMMYLVPMWLFFKPHLNDERPEVRTLAMAGMVIPMMFMDFGLTQTFLSHNSGRVVLCSLWMCVAGLMLNAMQASPKLTHP